METLRAGAPQPGGEAGGRVGGASTLVYLGSTFGPFPQSASGRGRAETSSRRGVDGGCDDDVPQSSGWARRRKPVCAQG